jgi:hypothetical protein
MTAYKRMTIRVPAALHRAMHRKAVRTRTSLSALVVDALKESLAEDADDLALVRQRAAEPSDPFEVVLRRLRARGRL